MPNNSIIHKEILTPEQIELLPMLKIMAKDFGLVGGTAIAFHLGHRRSIDFDLFSFAGFNNQAIKRRISRAATMGRVLVNRKGEFTFFTNNVKVTFFHFPYEINYKKNLDKVIKIPDLLTLAAMKAFALGQRAKWKDYADLYFIIKDHYSVDEIIKQGKKLFKPEFNPKIFRTQLSYFGDVSYREKITYLPGFEVDDEIIKKQLIEFSLT
ncbi:nucleotidyl transferase AbiEii/AbiGii toxin family protein [Candidatus Parcubacteria bacterium]|nr:nucleotidyl transferase AbiEii/AbiGii toxin family protein [Candidatus Parcubacteria bacterium]